MVFEMQSIPTSVSLEGRAFLQSFDKDRCGCVASAPHFLHPLGGEGERRRTIFAVGRIEAIRRHAEVLRRDAGAVAVVYLDPEGLDAIARVTLPRHVRRLHDVGVRLLVDVGCSLPGALGAWHPGQLEQAGARWHRVGLDAIGDLTGDAGDSLRGHSGACPFDLAAASLTTADDVAAEP